jgi:hypothetical protein
MTAPTTGATLKIALDQRASSRHDGFGTHSGPARGAPCKRALRPTATYAAAICYVRFTSIVFSNGSRAEALRVSTLSGACVLYVLVRHLMG